MISFVELINFLTKEKNYPIGYKFVVRDLINKINTNYGSQGQNIITIENLEGYDKQTSLFNKYLDRFFNDLFWKRCNYRVMLSERYDDAEDEVKVNRFCLFLYQILEFYSQLVLKYGQRIEFLNRQIENYNDYLNDVVTDNMTDTSMSEEMPDTKVGGDLDFPKEKEKLSRNITRTVRGNIFERLSMLNKQIEDVWGQFLREFDIYFSYERI